MSIEKVLYGKYCIPKVVSCEVKDGSVEIFTEDKNGINSIIKPFNYWLVSDKKFSKDFLRLEGDQFYKYIYHCDNVSDFTQAIKKTPRENRWMVHNHKEMAMLYYGFGYFHDLEIKDVSVLSFDIETTGVTHDDESMVILISNTYRKNGRVIKKLFSYDDYPNQARMLEAWCDWVREVNPSVVIGHNIYMFDIPYLAYIANREGTSLELGRDGSNLSINNYPVKFRKDGSQFYEFNDCSIYGREIVDTFFLSIKSDVARKFSNYRLKNLIQEAGLEKPDRQHYDAGSIRDNYTNPDEFNKIKAYAIDDADDALALYDLMIPSLFYYNRYVPKSFQQIINTATGSQLNSILVRAYLQDGHSLPKSSNAVEYQGAISDGNPGLYKNVLKVDFASLYPSIMVQYGIFDVKKDPNKYLISITEYMRKERLNDKHIYETTGSIYHKDLSDARKIIANSLYGMLGAVGLLFNSPEKAAAITRKGRELLVMATDWAIEKGFTIVNRDTDSISFTDGYAPLSKDDQTRLVSELNSIYPEHIEMAHDGYFTYVLVLKAKNYILVKENGEYKYKGSSIKNQNKEKALKEFMLKFIKTIIETNKDYASLISVYTEYVKEIKTVKDIQRWAFKKTVTETLYASERSNETKVLDAIREDEDIRFGDKILLYYKNDNTLATVANFNNDYNVDKLLARLFDTLKIFKEVVDIKIFPNYALKRNKKLLDAI